MAHQGLCKVRLVCISNLCFEEISYAAHENYYEHYRSVFDHVVDTLVIKGVVVPEFQEVAIVVLASSIILVVVFARKFKVMKILNS